MADPQSPKQAVFLHVPKSGGTSVARVMRNHFGDENVELVKENRFFTMPIAHLLRRWPFITGHFMARNLSNEVLRNAFVFTFLRDPVERLLSQYSYFRSLPPGNPNPDVGASQTLELSEVMKRCGTPGKFSAWSNWQTRIFAGCGPHEKATEETLAHAKHNLEQLAFVGLQEDLSACLTALVQRWGGTEPAEIPRLNPTPARTSAETLDDETRALIEEHHVLDHALYQHARDLWRKRHRPSEAPDLFTDILLTAQLGTKEIEIVSVGIEGDPRGTNQIDAKDAWALFLKMRSSLATEDLTVGLRITDETGFILYHTHTLWQGVKVPVSVGEFIVRIEFPSIPLAPGQYNLSIALHAGRPADQKIYHAIDNVLELKVVSATAPKFMGTVDLRARFQVPGKAPPNHPAPVA